MQSCNLTQELTFNLMQVLCKPKILPLKSVTLEKLENMQKQVCTVHVHSRKSDCLGCAVLLCLVCLLDLAYFFLSSFSSLI